jgi:hypothetical protein
VRSGRRTVLGLSRGVLGRLVVWLFAALDLRDALVVGALVVGVVLVVGVAANVPGDGSGMSVKAQMR